MIDDATSLLTGYREAVPTPGRTLCVGAGRSEEHLGFEEFEAALREARPGDRVVLDPGRHGYLNIFDAHGEHDAWISVEAGDLSDPPTIDVRAAQSDGVDIQRSDHIGLLGLVVEGDAASENPDASGVCVFRGSSFITVWGCTIRDFPGGGINCFWAPAALFEGVTLPAGGWDRVDLSFNSISGCCTRSPSNTSGISFFGAEDLDRTTTAGRFGYRAVGNAVVDCECLVPFRRGGYDFVTDGNGISVDSLSKRDTVTEALPAYEKWGLIEGNTVEDNGGRGIHVFNTTGVVVLGNRFGGNLRSRSPAFDRATEVEATTSPGAEDLQRGVELRANIPR